MSFSKLFNQFLDAFQLDVKKHKLQLRNLAINYAPFWDLDNGRTLCVKCHRNTANYGLKEYRKNISIKYK